MCFYIRFYKYVAPTVLSALTLKPSRQSHQFYAAIAYHKPALSIPVLKPLAPRHKFFRVSNFMDFFKKHSKEEAFWKWFEKNQNDLFHFEKDRETIFDRLSAALGSVHSDLTFEFSPIRDNGTREFVISAGGIKAAFPSVESLYKAAPKLAKWTVLKFRQRRFPINDLEFADKIVKASAVHYAVFKDDDPLKIGIMLFLDGYTEKDKNWGQIGYLFLDEALGEFDVENHIGAIVFFNRDSKYFEHARPLSELPEHFDEKLGRANSGNLPT